MKFNEMNIPPFIVDCLEKEGIVEPTEIQQMCIPEILKGKDVLGQSQTGSGKTFAYGIPAVCAVDFEADRPQVLIVCPTRELATQVRQEMKKVADESIKIVPIYGGADMKRQIVALKTADIVVGTPGRLMDHINRRTLKLHKIKMVVLDEADEMLKMGFKEDVEMILKGIPKTRQMVMFSATMPNAILEITKNFMNDPVVLKSNSGIESQQFVEQYYVNVARDKKNEALLELIKSLQNKTSIVFCNTKKMVDDLCDFLQANGVLATCMHGDKKQSERRRILDDIKRKGQGVLIGTDVIARGIDISNVDAVFNYDLPQDDEYYIHRIGRTARAGKDGKSYTLINTKNQLAQLKQLEKATKNTIVEYKLKLSVEREIGDLDLEQRPTSRRKNSRNDSRRNQSSFKSGNKNFGTKKGEFNKTKSSNYNKNSSDKDFKKNETEKKKKFSTARPQKNSNSNSKVKSKFNPKNFR